MAGSVFWTSFRWGQTALRSLRSGRLPSWKGVDVDLMHSSVPRGRCCSHVMCVIHSPLQNDRLQ